jgi:hypothetical protein
MSAVKNREKGTTLMSLKAGIQDVVLGEKHAQKSYQMWYPSDMFTVTMKFTNLLMMITHKHSKHTTSGILYAL